MKNLFSFLAAVALVSMTACSNGATEEAPVETPTEEVMETPTEEVAPVEAPADTTAAPVEAPAAH